MLPPGGHACFQFPIRSLTLPGSFHVPSTSIFPSNKFQQNLSVHHDKNVIHETQHTAWLLPTASLRTHVDVRPFPKRHNWAIGMDDGCCNRGCTNNKCLKCTSCLSIVIMGVSLNTCSFQNDYMINRISPLTSTEKFILLCCVTANALHRNFAVTTNS